MSPSPNGRWTCTPRFMSSIDTVPRCGANCRTASAGSRSPVTMQCPVSSARRRPGMPSAAQSSTVSISMPGSGSSAATVPSASARRATSAAPSAQPAPRLRRGPRPASARPPRTTSRPPRSPPRPRAPGTGTRPGAPAPPGRRVTSVGSCFAVGSSRKRAPVSTTQPSPSCRSRAATRRRCSGKVRRERIEMMDVERQRHAVIAGIGDQAERVVQPMVGGAVRVVGETQSSRPLHADRRAVHLRLPVQRIEPPDDPVHLRHVQPRRPAEPRLRARRQPHRRRTRRRLADARPACCPRSSSLRTPRSPIR